MIFIILSKKAFEAETFILWQEPVIVVKSGFLTRTTRWFVKGKWGISCFDFDILYIKKYADNPVKWCLDVESFFYYYRNLVNSIVGVFFRWYVELQFKGLGFKVFYNRNARRSLRLDVGYAHEFIYLNFVRSLSFNFKKRWRGAGRLVLCSTNKILLYQYVRTLISLRALRPYKFRGLFVWEWVFVSKLGKKKQYL